MTIVCVCGSGMGTSFVIKSKVSQFLKQNDIEATVESGSMSSLGTSLQSADIVLCQKYLAEALQGKVNEEKQVVLLIKNLMDANEYGPMILEAAENIKKRHAGA